MSQRIQHRAGSLTLAVLAAAAPLLWGDAAWAGSTDSGQSVVFSGGGVLGVTCAATPSRSSVTVPAESTLRVVNRTGFRARLLLDGAAQGDIGSGQSANVLFHRGPVLLSLRPACVLNGQPGTVRVQVAVAPRTQVSAAPASPGSRAPDAPVPRPVPAAPPTRGAGPDGAAPTRPSTDGGDRRIVGPAGAAPASGRGAPATASGGRPAAGSAVVPPGQAATATVAGAGPGAAEALPGPGLSAADTTGGSIAEPGEPVAAMDPASRTGPFRLLALVAIVCVFGAAAGAIRAIVAQRASRANIA